MGRKHRSPEEQERRAKMRELLHLSNVSSMEDIQNLFKETIAGFMEDECTGGLCRALGQEISQAICLLADSLPNLSTYFKFPQKIQRLIYTTNAIECFSRQLRKVTKAKSAFPTDDGLLKMLYLAMMDITKKWSMIHAQLAVYFADRMSD